METNFANRSGWRFSSELGIKGAGESGITAVCAAVANAAEDAIGMPVQSPSCQSRPGD
jgi:CO/xanthine dehydrogenase Mo-binding subunit